ncbi:MAG: TerC family protein [Planctomycetes bacterium]|nr:TerC family protein [Planctomycetota bacterium]
MDDLLSWLRAPVAIWVAFHLFVLVMLAIDLFIFQRHAHAVSMKEAAAWSVVWITLAFVFAFGIWQYWHVWHPDEARQGGTKAVEFITGYLIEKSLSVDNLFVFLVIFRYFGVPSHLQPRVLLWGILGALLMRISLILLGATLLQTFHWMIYIFGLFLIYTAYRLWYSVEEEIDPGKNPVLRLVRRFFRIADGYDTPHFWVKRDNRWHLTTLPVVILVIESTDVVFALDSIPAIFGITQDIFIVYTSNIFAILGLRALYFLLANLLGMFRYLSAGLSLILGFVGLKMITQDHLQPYLEQVGIGPQGLIFISLGVISAILVVAVVASIIAGPKEEPLEQPPVRETDQQEKTAAQREETP